MMIHNTVLHGVLRSHLVYAVGLNGRIDKLSDKFPLKILWYLGEECLD
jgi:hypothetical protein